MGGFGPLRKVSEANKSKRAVRNYGIVYFVNETVGDRFALRKVSVLRSWNRACVTREMESSLPLLTAEARMTEYAKESDSTHQEANFRLFALSGECSGFVHLIISCLGDDIRDFDFLTPFFLLFHGRKLVP